jgi:MFS family permease
MGLVGIAHAFSHFLQFALPPLFPLIHAELGYSYTELGLLITTFFVFSGLCQVIAGFIVDRIGARNVLLCGLGFLSGATLLYGVIPDYAVLVALVIVAGAGNSVFHPADFAILSTSIRESRMGRAFGVHAFMGFIGYGAAPAGMVLLAAAIGWREALIAVGAAGLVYLAILLLSRGVLGSHAATLAVRSPARSASASGLEVILRFPIVMLFLFFTALAAGQIGFQSFVPPALMELYGTDIARANVAVTSFLFGTLFGVLAGGVLADRARRHDLIAGLFMVVAGVVLVGTGLAPLPVEARFALFAVGGIAFGIVFPSRDLLIRASAPKDSTGKVFGFVYSGLDVGSALIPVVMGRLLDLGAPIWVFATIGTCFALAILALAASSRRGLPSTGATG